MTAARIIPVRRGGIESAESWVYVWVDASDGTVAYVGATRLDPQLRTHLHLTSDDPDHGRVRASVPHYEERDFDVLAFAIPAGIERADVKRALIAELSARPGDESDLDDTVAAIVTAVREHSGNARYRAAPNHP
ncbi:hypothetical protein [Microbacterium sp. P05]|uniref:hypothetical protein n=1 Tax=Microbacterium sp. P05 TaxID=3366948 RepID=UPI003745C855